MTKLKIRLSSIESIYLVYKILENAKTCLYGNKADDVFEKKNHCYILQLPRDENLWNIE